jgi:hypothetical protein
MPKRKEPEPTPAEQFKEFQKTARELGVDEEGAALERAFKRLAKKPRTTERGGGRPHRSAKPPSA